MTVSRLGLLVLIAAQFSACTVDKSGQSFSWPTSGLPVAPPAPDNGNPGGTPSAISLVDSLVLTYPVSAGAENIVFDGTYLVVPAITATDTISFGLINALSFTYTTSYPAIATGVKSIFAVTSNGAGSIFVLWTDSSDSISGSKYLSSWPTINPTTPTSTIVFDSAVYGCNTSILDFKIAYSISTFFGACTGMDTKLRLFSFDTSGGVISAISVSWPSSYNGGPVKGLTILNGNLVVAVNYGKVPWGVGFYKYNMSFQYQGDAGGSTGSLGDDYDSVMSLTTDGTHLYIGNGYMGGSCGASCYRYRFSKITKGNL